MPESAPTRPVASPTPCSIRFHLIRLVIAAVAPVWLIASLLVYHAFLTKREELNRSMLDTARSLTRVVDREIGSIEASLSTLSTSPSFAAGDLAAVHRQAQQVLKSYPSADILLADRYGQELLHTARPFGSPLPRRNNLDAVRRIFQTAKPTVSGLYTGAVTQQSQVSVDVPVIVNGTVKYDLALTLRSEPMAEVLRQATLRPDWYGLILDGEQILVARTPNSERSIGSKVPAALGDAAREGTVESSNLEGAPVLATLCRSALSNWSVLIEVPKGAVMAALYRWIGWAILAALLLTGLVLALIFGYARKIAHAIQSLVEPALSLGRAEMVPAAGSFAVKETAEVAVALEQAYRLLQTRAAQRDQAERELLHTIADLEKQTRERLDVLEKLSEKEQLLVQQGRQAAMGEMIGNIASQWRKPLNDLGQLIQQVPVTFTRGDLTKKYLDEVARKAGALINQMSCTLDEFRNFFRTDREKVKFRVNAEVQRTLLLLEGSFAKHGIGVEVQGGDDPYIYGYPAEFSQVLLNILMNSQEEFAKKAVPDPRVLITMGGENGRTVVTIADNAGGIPEEIMGKIFDPYFTTKEPKSGTGVGLFMSKTMIEKHMGGLLSVRNNDAGAEFSIEF